jgi:hypothetical protein
VAGKDTKRKDEIELDLKGWERFERAVNAATKHGPQDRHPCARAADLDCANRTSGGD